MTYLADIADHVTYLADNADHDHVTYLADNADHVTYLADIVAVSKSSSLGSRATSMPSCVEPEVCAEENFNSTKLYVYSPPTQRYLLDGTWNGRGHVIDVGGAHHGSTHRGGLLR